MRRRGNRGSGNLYYDIRVGKFRHDYLQKFNLQALPVRVCYFLTAFARLGSGKACKSSYLFEILAMIAGSVISLGVTLKSEMGIVLYTLTAAIYKG